MGRTAELERSLPAKLSNDIDQLKSEIKALTKKRKDLGRFLKIDEEKKALEAIRKEGFSLVDSAKSEASTIISEAENKAELSLLESNKIRVGIEESCANKIKKCNSLASKTSKDMEKLSNQREKIQSLISAYNAKALENEIKMKALNTKATSIKNALDDFF